MTSRGGTPPRANPFATRFVQPGAGPFLLPDNASVATLVRRLAEAGGRGQIIGPHGSGKSTLLANLLPELTAWAARVVRLDTTHRTPPNWVWGDAPPGTLLVIDGFEQLAWLARRRVRRHAPMLLVTAHRSVGLPTLHRTDVSAATAAAVVARLIPAGGQWVLDGYDVPARLKANRGSLRAVLFELYDRWEHGVV